MENDFMKRGYLLPDGCKDLIDVLERSKPPLRFFDASKLKHLVYLLKSKPQVLKFNPKHPLPEPLAPLPPVVGEIVIADQTTVSQLALLLGLMARWSLMLSK